MKTVITSSADHVEAAFDKRFGRAAWFCLVDEDSQKVEFIQNKNLDLGHGAGTKTAEMMVNLGVGKVISGDFGPKAKDMLDKFGIQMVIIQEDNLSVNDIVEKIKS